jgi:hypothetical protein
MSVFVGWFEKQMHFGTYLQAGMRSLLSKIFFLRSLKVNWEPIEPVEHKASYSSVFRLLSNIKRIQTRALRATPSTTTNSMMHMDIGLRLAAGSVPACARTNIGRGSPCLPTQGYLAEARRTIRISAARSVTTGFEILSTHGYQ